MLLPVQRQVVQHAGEIQGQLGAFDVGLGAAWKDRGASGRGGGGGLRNFMNKDRPEIYRFYCPKLFFGCFMSQQRASVS